jgi:hypothetical protein
VLRRSPDGRTCELLLGSFKKGTTAWLQDGSHAVRGVLLWKRNGQRRRKNARLSAGCEFLSALHCTRNLRASIVPGAIAASDHIVPERGATVVSAGRFGAEICHCGPNPPVQRFLARRSRQIEISITHVPDDYVFWLRRGHKDRPASAERGGRNKEQSTGRDRDRRT